MWLNQYPVAALEVSAESASVFAEPDAPRLTVKTQNQSPFPVPALKFALPSAARGTDEVLAAMARGGSVLRRRCSFVPWDLGLGAKGVVLWRALQFR